MGETCIVFAVGTRSRPRLPPFQLLLATRRGLAAADAADGMKAPANPPPPTRHPTPPHSCWWTI
jgi:hypothetical protein